MPPEIAALIDKPVYLIAVLFVGALAGMTVEQVLSKQRRSAWKRRNSWRWKDKGATGAGGASAWKPRPDSTPAKVPDAADQLRIVMGAEFAIQPLLNRSEMRVFQELDKMVIVRNAAWQVMAQVSLGEILRTKDSDAYRCVNSKRVDLLLVDEHCHPIHAIEYQGDGHHIKGGAAAARDAVKKEALRKAGIGYHEVVAGHTTKADLMRLVEKLVPARP